MKHIFVVHSPITYLAALGAILKEKIDEKDVVIISEIFSLSYEPIPIARLLKPQKSNKLNFIFQPSIQKRLYDFLDKSLNGEDFIAYIPIFHNINRFLVLHKNCKGFHFIEEGLSAYCSHFNLCTHMTIPFGSQALPEKKLKNRLQQITKEVIWILKGYTSKLRTIPTFYTAYVHDPSINFYGFNELSHRFSENAKTISFKDVFSHYEFKSVLNLKNCYIWISDPDMHITCNTTIDEYLDVIRRGYINFLKRNNITFTYLRFHYRDDEKQRKRLLNFFEEESIETIVIPNHIVMELELINSENVTLFGFYSSLLFYGSLFGCKSYSIIDEFENPDKDLINRLEFFWKEVERVL